MSTLKLIHRIVSRFFITRVSRIYLTERLHHVQFFFSSEPPTFHIFKHKKYHIDVKKKSTTSYSPLKHHAHKRTNSVHMHVIFQMLKLLHRSHKTVLVKNTSVSHFDFLCRIKTASVTTKRTAADTLCHWARSCRYSVPLSTQLQMLCVPERASVSGSVSDLSSAWRYWHCQGNRINI